MDRRDGLRATRRSIVHVEDGIVISLSEKEPDVVCDYLTLSGVAATEGPVDSAWQPFQDTLWKSHEVSLLAKVSNAKLVKDFRPIAILLAIYKLYSRVMYMLAENTCNRLYAPQFAFRKFHQAHEVVFIMRQLIEKALEWKAPEVYIMDGDIKEAYDYASHVLFAEAARSRGMHEVLILALIHM